MNVLPPLNRTFEVGGGARSRHVRLMVEDAMINEETMIYSIGIRDSENTVNVGVDEEWSPPDTWEYYIQ